MVVLRGAAFETSTNTPVVVNGVNGEWGCFQLVRIVSCVSVKQQHQELSLGS